MTLSSSSTSQKSEQDTSPEVTTGKSLSTVVVLQTVPTTKLRGSTSSNEDDSDCSTASDQINGAIVNSKIENGVQNKKRHSQEKQCEDLPYKLCNGRGGDRGQRVVRGQLEVSHDDVHSDAILPTDGWTEAHDMDTLDHQTHDQSLMRQPRLEFSGRFTNDGSILKDPRTDVVLTVRAGAVPPGEIVDVCVKIHTDLMSYTKWVPNESASILGPVVECEMDRKMTFQKPVTLSIPLCNTPLRSLDVLCSDGNSFKDIALDKDMSYRIEGSILHIDTTHFTKFLVQGEVVSISNIVLTLAARFSTGSCSTLELRPMAHVNCLTTKEFVKDRELSYHEDMEIIDSQPVSLPERGQPLEFPEILIKTWVKEDSQWKLVDSENSDTKSCSLEKRIHGMDVLNTVNSESRPLKNFLLESTGIVKQAECRMNVTFKYEEDSVEPVVNTFSIVYPKYVNHTDPSPVETIATADKLLRKLSVTTSSGSEIVESLSTTLRKISSTDNGYQEEQVAVLAKSIINELQKRKPKLVGAKGFGVHAMNVQFRARIESLEILDNVCLQPTQTSKTPSEAAAALIEQMLPCAHTKLVLFAWLLLDVGQDHQLPDSITPDVKIWLRVSEDEIVQQMRKIDS